jgi:hypothetical protein
MSMMSKPTDTGDPELMRAVLGPAGPELTCEECFQHLDRYVELELSGADADAGVPGMHAHLSGCPACGEDHESLLELVRSEQAGPDPTGAETS